jgi:hypothetical protein
VACQCNGPWTGQYCSQYVSSCTKGYCSNGGTCYELSPGVPSCYCPPCYTGSICQSQLDLCSPANAPCLNNGYCVSNLPTNCSYSCTCSPGFTGLKCERQIDECQSSPCVNGQCYDMINGYYCLCEIGFTGPICNIKMSSCSSSPCLNNGICRDNVSR